MKGHQINRHWIANIASFSVMLSLVTSPASALEIDLESLEGGLILAERGRFSDCAQEWERAGGELAREGGRESLSAAGVAYVAASRCYESDDDAAAYQAWAQGVRYFLEAGTQWTDILHEISKQISQTEKQLSQQEGIDLGDKNFLDLEGTMLLRLDSSLDLLDFTGPRAGLHRADLEAKKNNRVRMNNQPVPAHIPQIFSDPSKTSTESAVAAEIFDTPVSGSIMWLSDERIEPAHFDYESDGLEESASTQHSPIKIQLSTVVPPLSISPSTSPSSDQAKEAEGMVDLSNEPLNDLESETSSLVFPGPLFRSPNEPTEEDQAATSEWNRLEPFDVESEWIDIAPE